MRALIPVTARGVLAAVYILAIALVACTAAVTSAVADTGQVLASGDFEKKRKNTRGGYEIVETETGRVLRLNTDFVTGRGPDIKIFLSPLALAEANGDNAVTGSILLGQLASRKGAAQLAIPDDVDLAAFQSVLVHCEEFSVLFGGAPLS